MIETIYVEAEVASHPRVEEILARFPKARRVDIERYGEVFNRKAQSFRLQKQQASLILARKHGKHVLDAPPGYGIGGASNFYFSHMLNCLYDCRYCFLQGMYRSAHYVLYVDYEDFGANIERIAARYGGETPYFFSGYDCDSLALEPVTGFAAWCLDLFAGLPEARLELRTKSTQIRGLLDRAPLNNCIVAFSLSPQTIIDSLEHKTPTLRKRLDALRKLQQAGWPIGLRFDPVVDFAGCEQAYEDLFHQVFELLDPTAIHSVSLGMFRLPRDYYARVQSMYPEEALFAHAMQDIGGMRTYPPEREQQLFQRLSEALLKHISGDIFFPARL